MEKIELFRSRFLLFLSFRFCFAQSVCDVPTADLWGSEGIHSFGALHGRFTASLEWPKIMRMPPGNRHRIANSISRICTDCDVSEFTRFDQIWDMGAHPALYLRQSVSQSCTFNWNNFALQIWLLAWRTEVRKTIAQPFLSCELIYSFSLSALIHYLFLSTISLYVVNAHYSLSISFG